MMAGLPASQLVGWIFNGQGLIADTSQDSFNDGNDVNIHAPHT